MAETKKKKAGTGDAGKVTVSTTPSTDKNILDVEHEEVKDQPGDMKIMTVEESIKMEIVKFNLADAAIAEMKTQYGALVITGPDDKTGYKAVKDAWNDTRSKRTGLEKKGLELRNGYGVITKAIKKEEDRLVELITPLEDELYDKWKEIDNEKERLKKEAEEKEAAELNKRLAELEEAGMTFSAGFYRVGEDISMDIATLRAMPEDQYLKLKETVIKKVADIKELQRQADEKKEQERQEFQRQQDLLKQQQDDLKKQQQDMERQRQELQQQKEEAAKLKREMRTTKLLNLGMTYAQRADLFEFDNGFKSVTHGGALLFDMDDYGFEEHLKVLAGLIKESKDGKEQHDLEVAKEKAERNRREKLIADKLQAAGMSFNFSKVFFHFSTNDTEQIIASWNDFVDMSDADIEIKVKEFADKIAANKKEQQRIDTERQNEQQKQEKLAMSDKTRYATEHAYIAGAATKMVPGEFKTKKYQQRAQAFLERLTNLLKEFE